MTSLSILVGTTVLFKYVYIFRCVINNLHFYHKRHTWHDGTVIWQTIAKTYYVTYYGSCSGMFKFCYLDVNLVILHAFCRLLIFFRNQLFQENTFRNTIRFSNSLDPDQARQFVVSDLDPNCLQKLSADDASR